MNKILSIIFLVIVAIFAQLSWIIEFNPYSTNDFNWASFVNFTFFFAPFLFIIWLIVCKYIIFKIKNITIVVIAYYLLFNLTLILIYSSHASGISALIISKLVPFSNNGLLIILALSITSFVFNKIMLYGIGVKIEKISNNIVLYFYFYIILISLIVFSIFLNIINANNTFNGFDGFNNWDTILWFKSGAIIPLTIMFEGILVIKVKNLTTAST